MITGKKTKIVATIGPASENEEMMTKLIKAGLNVVRLNFSHGSHEEHRNRIRVARRISEKMKIPVAILQDLSGPKIRIGDFSTDSVILKENSKFTLTTKEIIGSEKEVYVNYEMLPKEVKSGNILYLNDGKIKLKIEEVSNNEIVCKVIQGGEINGRRGLNAPGANLSLSSLTKKDLEDLRLGIKESVDFIAISFVRRASDISELKEMLKKEKADIKVIAKIETQEAVDNFDEILSVSDGIMIARGDLAMEVPAEEVPIIQKTIIKKCNALGKPVITATQMLASMTSSSTATRAEINDVANAILDGTDAVMLSEETTIGKHPEEAVKTMTSVALHTEKHFKYESRLKYNHLISKDITGSVSFAAANIAHDIDAKAIVALTISGFTARMIARYKPNRPILVITPNKKTYNSLALSWNCYPILTQMFDGITKTLEISKELILKHNLAKKEDLTVISAGVPFSQSGNTNLVLVQKV